MHFILLIGFMLSLPAFTQASQISQTITKRTYEQIASSSSSSTSSINSNVREQENKYQRLLSALETNSDVETEHYNLAEIRSEFSQQYDPLQNQLLLRSSMGGDVETVKDLIQNKNANPHTTSACGMPALLNAIAVNRIEVVQFLISIPTIIDAINAIHEITKLDGTPLYTHTPLTYAIDHNRHEIIQLLLDIPEIDVNIIVGTTGELMKTIQEYKRYKDNIFKQFKQEKN